MLICLQDSIKAAYEHVSPSISIIPVTILLDYKHFIHYTLLTLPHAKRNPPHIPVYQQTYQPEQEEAPYSIDRLDEILKVYEYGASSL